MTHFNDQGNLEGVALIGMAGRFPGADTVEQFWQNLIAGKESITFFSDEELIAAGVDRRLLASEHYVKANAVLDEIQRFDAAFFGFTPREAEILDPQQRLFLECAWHALEDAAYVPDTFDGAIGVYAGSFMSTYLLNLYSHPELLESVGDLALRHGNDKDYVATRVSYKLNLRGPSISVQTACSTSLVAVHLASQALLNGECDLALAGGASIITPQTTGYLHQTGGIVSPDGHCRAFDAQAGGTVFGNGVGIVVLKRLADALEDGDQIYAVIKGSAINNDGAQKVGYTAPSVDGQTAVIQEAMLMADFAPETIGYVEAHGTGTALGDPIEITALAQAFGGGEATSASCPIGSLKTNVGHLSAAAGVAGLIKTALVLKHSVIPPSLHFSTANPNIPFAQSPFYVNTQLSDWPSGTWRRAGISSFGMGGTNAHVLLEGAPAREASPARRPWQLVTLSARTPTALATMQSQLAGYLDRHPELSLADLAYTLHVGRKAFDQRATLVANDIASLRAQLDSTPGGLTASGAAARPGVAFLFPGQGAQYVDMGRALYESEPLFRETVDRCAALLMPQVGIDLRSVIYPAEAGEEGTARLNQTDLAQPALFVIEYALAQLWLSWGVKPNALIGHSIGEYVAATLAGVFSLEDALALIAVRGRLMQQLPSGAMLSVALPVAELEPLLHPEGTRDVTVAAVNSRNLCTISGPAQAIARLHAELREQGIDCRPLHTSHAFHSPLMEPILSPFAKRVARVRLAAPQIPFVSNVTGTWITPEQAIDPYYWARHLREPVLFGPGLETLLQAPDRLLLEVGPGQTLSTLAKDLLGDSPDDQPRIIASLRHPKDQRADEAVLLAALGRLWAAGVTVDWPAFHADERRRRISLPLYPFEGERYWIEANPSAGLGLPQPPAQPSLTEAPLTVPIWKQSLSPATRRRAPHTPIAGPVLVLHNGSDLCAQVVSQLQQMGGDVISVFQGRRYLEQDAQTAMLRADQLEDYQRLIGRLADRDRLPELVVSFWAIQYDTTIGLGDAAVSLRLLAQSLGSSRRETSVQLVVVSDRLQIVTGEEAPEPASAALIGLCRGIEAAYPGLTCRSIDLALMQSQAGARLAAKQLLAELHTPSEERMIAYRGRQRWVQTFEPLDVPPVTLPTSELRAGGVYLLVGGLDGINRDLAMYLRRALNARLILVDAQPQTSERLPAEPSEALLIFTGDLSDAELLSQARDAAVARFGVIDGVIAAPPATAEPSGDGLAGLIDYLPTLAQVLEPLALDFLLLCSSRSVRLGHAPALDDCAAAAFLDAYAAQMRTQRDGVVTVVHWDRAFAALPGAHFDAFAGDVLGRVLEHDLTCVLVARDGLEPFDEHMALPAAGDAVPVASAVSSVGAHPRPALSSPYVAPRTDAERSLAEIWQALLGVEPVGVQDNFFELGGDSVKSIQVVSRAQQYGLRLTPDQIFEHQTIAELVAAVQSALLAAKDLAGPLPVTPAQTWLLGHGDPDRQASWSMSLNVPLALESPQVDAVIRALLSHHDVLRLSFGQSDAGWLHSDAGVIAQLPCSEVELRSLPSMELDAVTRQVSAELQARLSPAAGHLLAAAILRLGPQQSRLLLVIHQLAVDLRSWLILLEDLQQAYQQLSAGMPLALQTAGSFRQWTYEHAQQLPLPTAQPVAASWDSAVVALTAEETRALLEAVPPAYHTTTDEVLLTAFAQIWAAWTGESELSVELVSDRRSVDLPRVVGCFIDITNTCLTINPDDAPTTVLKEIKEQLRSARRDMSVQRQQQPTIGFSYQEPLTEQIAKVFTLGTAQLVDNAALAAPHSAAYLLDIRARIVDDRLEVRWIFSPQRLEPDVMSRQIELFLDALRSLIAACQAVETSGYTPSDFPTLHMSQDDLDDLLASLDLPGED